MMSNAHFRRAIASTNDVLEVANEKQTKVLDELRKEIALNTTKINTILQRTPLQTPRNPRSQLPTTSRKRPRLLIDEPSNNDNVSVGTRDIGPNESIPLAASQREEKFWLYLSGFDPHATTQQIENLVKGNLNITDGVVDVAKLVPKGRTLDELTFVSFKVGLDPQLKEIALSGSSWQKGIIFRQFDFGHSTTTRTTFRFQSSPGESHPQ